MKIIGIGVDIVKNKRISSSIRNKGFINRTFGKNEILVSKKTILDTHYYSFYAFQVTNILKKEN